MFSVNSSIQLDSIAKSNFIQLKFSENDYLSGEAGDGMKKNNLFSVVVKGHIWFKYFRWRFLIGWGAEKKLIGLRLT